MVLQIDVREALLDAADRMLARFGYRKMTMEDVARAAGVGKGTIYLHFDSKEELALCTIERIVERVVRRLQAIADGPGTVGEKIAEMLEARVTIRLDAVRHYSESLDELLSVIRPALLERRKQWFRREERVLARVLAEGMESGELVREDPRACARDLLAATTAFLPFSLTADQIGKRKEVAARVRRMANLLLHGLSAT